MSKTVYTNEFIAKELQELRDDVSVIRGLLEQSGRESETAHFSKLIALVRRTGGSRKPFTLYVSGIFTATIRVSAVRAALFIVALADLQRRLDGEPSIPDRPRRVREAVLELDPEKAVESNLDNSLRVAQYRFEFFVADHKCFDTDGWKLSFDSRLCEFNLLGRAPRSLAKVEVMTDDAVVATQMVSLLACTPLQEIRKRGSVFVPPGPSGFHKLLLEIYDHPFPMSATTLHFRIAAVSQAPEFLRRTGASREFMQRSAIAAEAFAENRLALTEVIPRQTLWDLIRVDSRGHLISYPGSLTVEDGEQQLCFLDSRLASTPTYNLIISDCQFPVHVGLYEINSPPGPDLFTLFFFRHETPPSLNKVTCYASADPGAFRGVGEGIVKSVLAHPTTTSDRATVRETIAKIREHLRSEGPLREGQDIAAFMGETDSE